jgi:hypothetical protein
MTTYQPQEQPMNPDTVRAAWLAALLRDLAIVVAVIIYAIDTL